MKVYAPVTANRLRREGEWDRLLAEIAALPDRAAMAAWRAEFILTRHRTMPWYWQEAVFEALADRETAFANADMDAEYRELMRA